MTKRPTMGHLNPAAPLRADVRHICPWCGGDFAEHLGALIAVTMCRYCHGAGTLSDDELSAALSLDEYRSRQGLT